MIYWGLFLQLVLEASDRGTPSLSTQVEITVYIEDVDDNPPTFPVCLQKGFNFIFISVIWQEPPHYTISEAQPILTPFAILQTEDVDTAPENKEAHYYITGESQKILYLIV